MPLSNLFRAQVTVGVQKDCYLNLETVKVTIVAGQTAEITFPLTPDPACDNPVLSGSMFRSDAAHSRRLHRLPNTGTTVSLLWSYMTDNSEDSSPAVVDGVVYIGGYGPR